MDERHLFPLTDLLVFPKPKTITSKQKAPHTQLTCNWKTMEHNYREDFFIACITKQEPTAGFSDVSFNTQETEDKTITTGLGQQGGYSYSHCLTTCRIYSSICKPTLVLQKMQFNSTGGTGHHDKLWPVKQHSRLSNYPIKSTSQPMKC